MHNQARLFLAAILVHAIAARPEAEPAHAASAGEPLSLLEFEGKDYPVNKAGAAYPNPYGGKGGCQAKVGLASDPHFGGVARFEVLSGSFYPQFNAHNADGTRGFAREYVRKPASWKFNTYNRLTFWIRCPAHPEELNPKGRNAVQLGTYVKRVGQADSRSDEAGGGHWYHHLNLPYTGSWTKVVINAHPHHRRGDKGGKEQGLQLHPTGEEQYNYFDALTRFYLHETRRDVAGAPLVYLMDRFRFEHEPAEENDQQIYSIAATFDPATNRHILTWARNKDENRVRHEVRYAYRSIHEIGWDAAQKAPGGLVEPAGSQGYNGMVYQTRALPAKGPIWFAIKPENSRLFSQIELAAVPPAQPEKTLKTP